MKDNGWQKVYCGADLCPRTHHREGALRFHYEPPEWPTDRPSTNFPTLFVLERIVDHSGVSGTGVVADGVRWADGRVTLKWRGRHSSVGVYEHIEAVEAIHGHDGDTQIRWRPGE